MVLVLGLGREVVRGGGSFGWEGNVDIFFRDFSISFIFVGFNF